MKLDSKKPSYCCFFRDFELLDRAVSAVLIRFFCNWVRWKADYQRLMIKKIRAKNIVFSWRKFILKNIFLRFPQTSIKSFGKN